MTTKQKIVVTGGAGFIGSHTVIALHEAGYMPIIVDNFSNSDETVIDRLSQVLGVRPVSYFADCTDLDVLRDVFEREDDVSGVIHFAAYKSVPESVQNPLKYYRNNFISLISLLEAAKEYTVPNILFSSSCTVYGDPKEVPVTEETERQHVSSPYGLTKQVGETVLKSTVTADAALKAISLRYFNPIGAHSSGYIGESPKEEPQALVPLLLQAARGGKKLVVAGTDYPTPDGSCVRDFVHVMDVAEAHVKALTHLQSKQGGFYDIYNIGIGKGTSVLELISLFEKATGISVPYERGQRREGDIPQIFASVNKAAEELGWSARRTVEDALIDAWRWQQK